MTLRSFKLLLLAVIAALLFAGCAAQEAFRAAKERFGEGQTDAGFVQLQEALRLEPNNAAFRSFYILTRDRLVAAWLREADLARLAGKPDDALAL